MIREHNLTTISPYCLSLFFVHYKFGELFIHATLQNLGMDLPILNFRLLPILNFRLQSMPTNFLYS